MQEKQSLPRILKPCVVIHSCVAVHFFGRWNNKVHRGRSLSPFDYFLVLNYVKAVSSVEAERDFLWSPKKRGCVGCRKRAKPSKNESESPAENSVTEFSMRSEARKTCWFFWPFSRSWNEIRTWNFEGRHRVHSARKDKVRLQSKVELRLEKLSIRIFDHMGFN